jgi:DivIVA domain-containing protein
MSSWPPSLHNSMMYQDDAGKRISELERQLAEAHADGDPGANREYRTTGGWLTPEQVSNLAFAMPPRGQRGYREDEVDAFLHRVQAALQDPTGGILTPEQVRGVAFSTAPFRQRGYSQQEVDAFLDLVEQQVASQRIDAVGQPPQGFDTPMVAGQPSTPRPGPNGAQRFDTPAVDKSQFKYFGQPGVGHRNGPRSQLRRRMARLAVAGALVVSIVFFSLGAYKFYSYLVGTPTTATIEGCSKDHWDWSCTSTWSVGEQSYAGKLSLAHRHSEGSSLGVRVLRGKAYTAFSGVDYVVIGLMVVLVTAFGIVRVASEDWFDPWLNRRPKWFQPIVRFFRTLQSDGDNGGTGESWF